MPKNGNPCSYLIGMAKIDPTDHKPNKTKSIFKEMGMGFQPVSSAMKIISISTYLKLALVLVQIALQTNSQERFKYQYIAPLFMKKGLVVILVLLLSVGVAHAGFFDWFSGLFGAEPTPPEIVGAIADPMKVKPGMPLRVVVEVRDSYGIQEAKAYFQHEKGEDELPLVWIQDRANGAEALAAQWHVHDTKDLKWYKTRFVITNTKGLTTEGEVEWQDPTVSHTPDEIIPGTFGNGDYTFPGNVTFGNFSLSNNVGASVCAQITGGSSLCDGVDSDTSRCPSGSCTGFLALNNNVLFIRGSSQTERIFYDGTNMVVRGSSDLILEATAGDVQIADNLEVTTISSDGTGKAVCILGDGNLGTCTNAVGGSGTCTCT